MAEEDQRGVVVHRHRYGRAALFIALGLLVLLLIAIAGVWIERRPIATHYLKGEFERRGVTASYHLDRVGLRIQEVSNLVIGDPKRPDLVARFARIETRLKLNGNFEVYRIVARGVRLRGPPDPWPDQLGRDRQIDAAAIEQAVRAALVSPSIFPTAASRWRRRSARLVWRSKDSGKLSGGFAGRAAIVSPSVTPGRCGATNIHAYVAVAVVAPGARTIDGPVTADTFGAR